jgi:hypothetical protein
MTSMAELPPLLEITPVFALDPASAELGILAVYKLRFPEFDATQAMALEHPEFLRTAIWTQQALKKELTSIAQERSPEAPIVVNVIGLRFGSLEFTAVVALITGATFQFFANYENLRKGFILFTEDLAKGARRLNNSATVAYWRAIRNSQDPSVPREHGPDDGHVE